MTVTTPPLATYPSGIALLCEDPAQEIAASQLANEYGFPLINTPPTHGHALCLHAGRLELREFGRGAAGPVWVDFGGSELKRRTAGGKGLLLAKAVGFKHGTPSIVDATAGLGRDSFTLAALGAPVCMIERNPLPAALVADGLRRAAQDPATAEISHRIQFHFGSAQTLLTQWQGEKPDTVLIDPMFPEPTKRAKSKKEMHAFQTLVGPDLDSDLLLEPALALACRRVAVKRPRHAPWLANQKPDLNYEGESVRFDIYLVKA
ncbi:class I SAM-dependent methyltransferase [Parachitinimonas caeni]|uniref:Ribosomal RNA small subunit methyltransferase J n=1 Tax=Parachitinimonas caeni TaxID=3031301 RepID=A0ABT7DU23_9NEIS|nr:class I SAM-dependent methyltransferase [Parachitinimonas caeni]MDK2123571.1 class I SAM-dependent methyltransferase [Parachitinimonas caeni]